MFFYKVFSILDQRTWFRQIPPSVCALTHLQMRGTNSRGWDQTVGVMMMVTSSTVWVKEDPQNKAEPHIPSQLPSAYHHVAKRPEEMR
jgi:hypothetical protein